jgi:hypothetical protein
MCDYSIELNTVESYLKSGKFVATKTFGDTIINFNYSDSSLHYYDGASEFIFIKYEQIKQNAQIIETNAKIKEFGKKEFEKNCISCHYKLNLGDNFISKIDFERIYRSQMPLKVKLNIVTYYKFDKSQEHSFYFILSEFKRLAIFLYLDSLIIEG